MSELRDGIPAPVLQLASFGEIAPLTVDVVREALADAHVRTRREREREEAAWRPTPEMMTLVLR